MQEANLLELSIFFILTAFILGGIIAMLTNKQTVFSAFGFLIAMIGIAGLFSLLGSRFLAIAQIMVSVGAIVILSMLTILTLNAKEEQLPKEPHKYKWILLTSFLVAPFTLLLFKALQTLPDYFTQTHTLNAKIMGDILFSEWVLPFEILSILLLTAMIGAIVIARKEEIQ